MKGYLETGDAPWTTQLIGRYAFFGLSGHALYTGLLGAGIGLAVQDRRRPRPVRSSWVCWWRSGPTWPTTRSPGPSGIIKPPGTPPAG